MEQNDWKAIACALNNSRAKMASNAIYQQFPEIEKQIMILEWEYAVIELATLCATLCPDFSLTQFYALSGYKRGQ